MIPLSGAILNRLLFVWITVVTCYADSPCYEGNEIYNGNYICNNGTQFACVCYENPNDNHVSKIYPNCTSLIISDHLNVIKLSVQFQSHSAVRMPNEYFKRYKVASDIERYCTKGTHECMETTLPLKKDTNVIILKVSCPEHMKSTLYYTVAKPLNPTALSLNNTMKPEKVIFIMNSTMTNFSWEVLAGEVKLLEHSPAELIVKPKPKISMVYQISENIVFFIFLIVLGFVVGIIYIIAIIKVIRDHRRKTETRKRERNKKQQENPSTANYGSINHTTDAESSVSAARGRCSITVENQKSSTSRQNSTVVSVTVKSTTSTQRPTSIQQEEKRDLCFAPLRIGDVGAYEAAEPEYQSPTSLFNYLISLFKIGKIDKTTSSHNVSSSSKYPNAENAFSGNSGVKKSKTVHQTLSSPGAAIINNPLFSEQVDVSELKEFYKNNKVKKSKNENQAQQSSVRDRPTEILKISPPEIKIDFEYAQAPVDEDFYPDEIPQVKEIFSTEEPVEAFADFGNFADSKGVVVNGFHDNDEARGDYYAKENNAEDTDWPVVVNKKERKLSAGAENLHNSLSAAAILTTSYTEENLIKSETSSLAESRSNSESDLSEKSFTLNPLADYQPLRESTWSVNRQESGATDEIVNLSSGNP